jgi:hypothetical protein
VVGSADVVGSAGTVGSAGGGGAGVDAQVGSERRLSPSARTADSWKHTSVSGGRSFTGYSASAPDTDSFLIVRGGF